MKLKAELKPFTDWIERNFDKVIAIRQRLIEWGGYRNFAEAFAWSILRSAYTDAGICRLYKEYDCNDKHIDSLALAGLKQTHPELLTVNNNDELFVA